MKYNTILTAIFAVRAAAQREGPKCKSTKDILAAPLPDPLVQLNGSMVNFPCDMGGAIPLGPIPTGCADLEVIVARGTTEPGPLGMVVGDPLVARLVRDMKSAKARGYPVQVRYDSFCDLKSCPKLILYLVHYKRRSFQRYC